MHWFTFATVKNSGARESLRINADLIYEALNNLSQNKATKNMQKILSNGV